MMESNRNKAISEYKETIIRDLEALGVNPDPYHFAIQMTAETLFERNVAYEEYLENGGKNTNEKGKSDATSVRLSTWNSQLRFCLYMLNLTPASAKGGDNS